MRPGSIRAETDHYREARSDESSRNGKRRGSRRFACKNEKAGFTLVEALVSLAVLAISLAAIGSLMSANMRTALALERHLSLTETARALWTALPDRNGPDFADLSGEMAGQRWRLAAQPYLNANAERASPSPWVPRLVTMRVQSPSGAILQIDTLRLQKRIAR
jgi:general secretion pathway protein I